MIVAGMCTMRGGCGASGRMSRVSLLLRLVSVSMIHVVALSSHRLSSGVSALPFVAAQPH